MCKSKFTHRIIYWRQVNPEYGEWVRTGLMPIKAAEEMAEHLRHSHERVEVYEDEGEGWKG